jgi:hypothetical protein
MFGITHQIRGMETPAFTHGEEMPPPSFGLVSIFTLTPFSKWYHIGKALHFCGETACSTLPIENIRLQRIIVLCIKSSASSRNTSRRYSVSLRADRAAVNLPMVSNLRVQGQSPRLIAHLRRTPVQVSGCEAMLMSGVGFVYILYNLYFEPQNHPTMLHIELSQIPNLIFQDHPIGLMLPKISQFRLLG